MGGIHLYLSPHLDDAILSCGGIIQRQRGAGEQVVVITLCAGSPDYGTLSPFAQAYHTAWGAGSDLVAQRRAEDVAVLGRWGVGVYHCSTPDSIYRRVDGKAAYENMAALFAEPQAKEVDALPAAWMEELRNLYSPSADNMVYAPLAAGNHVDHQLARRLGWLLGKDGWQVWFYEDYPHAESPGARRAAQDWFGSDAWHARTIRIDVNAKLEAMRGYKTQMGFIFGAEESMIRRVKSFTAEVACEISRIERVRRQLAGAGGRRERMWRRILGYHAYGERIWRPCLSKSWE